MDPTPSPDELRELADLASELAHAAGALILMSSGGRARQLRLGPDATRKTSITDLSTEADHASEALITEALTDRRPNDGILAEEGSTRSSSSGLTWIIDPIDGTTNFVYGYSPFCVSIAVADAQGSLVGVVHDPVARETFAATRGLGAARDGEPLRLDTPPPLGEALVGTGFGYRSERRAAQAALLPTVLPAVRDIRRGGSAALDLCSVACGRLDGFYEAGLRPWDRAAGLLIAIEAGATFADLDGLVEGAPTLVVAAAPLHGELTALLLAAAKHARTVG